MSWGRGQGAAEYLVVFGAVLLVSAVVVSSLGSMSGMGDSAKAQQTIAAWKTASPFTISAFKLTSDSITLVVTDNVKKKLRVTGVEFSYDVYHINLWVPDGSQSKLFFTGAYTSTLSNSSFRFAANPCYGRPVGAAFEFKNVTFVYSDGSISGIRQTGPALAGQCSINSSESGAPAGATPTPSAAATPTPSAEPSVAATPTPSVEPTPSPSPSPIPYALLSGWVRDANGVGLPSALVNLTNSTPSQSAVANASGYYSLNVSLGGQSAVFAASASGNSSYNSTAAVVSFAAETPASRDFVLGFEAASISGTILDANGEGVVGATVSFGDLSNTTVAGGAFVLSNSSMLVLSYSGTLAVDAGSSYNTSSKAVTAVAGSVASGQNLTLSFLNASLSGFVEDSAGDAVSGANVSWGVYSNVTNASGYYLLSGIVMSNLSVSDTLLVLKSPTYSPRSLSVSVVAGGSNVTDFDAAYSRPLAFIGATVSGYVLDSVGVGISGGNVSCGDYFSATAGDGLYSISGVAMSSASSSCTLNASKSPTFVSNLTNVSLSAGGSTSQNLRLSYANASVSGFIRDGSSVGVSGATVACGAFSTASSSDGSYAINGITMSAASSSCTLAASKSGYTSNSSTASLSAGVATSGQSLVLNLIVNGVCGPANGFGRAYVPTGADLCSAGTASTPSGSNPWSWNCMGLFGGTNASCATINASYSTTVVSFTNVGTTNWTVPAGVTSVDYLVVGGGGGGGSGEVTGGGGGAGGIVAGAVAVSGYVAIIVGSGGTGGNDASGGNGGDSGLGNITAVGGGGGGGGHNAGNTGGSGGGGGGSGWDTYVGGGNTPGQGSSGGSGNVGYMYGGGGGGGASTAGITGAGSAGGNGGTGTLSSITGQSVAYAGGGGGGIYCGGTPGVGGLGGGGNASSSGAGLAGTNGTGGGGAGGTNYLCPSGAGVGGPGGSGIVVVRYVAVVPGSCGSSNGSNVYSAPSTNLCSSGSASAVGGSGPWSWTCSGSNGGASASCSANLAVNGVCGSSNGAGFYSVPTSNFCSAGSASAVSGSGPWSWSCIGAYGGTNASCSALLKVDGACGSKNGKYTSSTPTGTQACTAGTITGMGGSYSWSCVGTNGGTNASCATVAAAYQVVSFTTVGTSSWTVPAGVTSVELLVVGGGGGGGGPHAYAGGGGGGGVVYCVSKDVSGTISVTAGAGGVGGGPSSTTTNGDSSSFGDIVAIGGGAGGPYSHSGYSGGSGGGAGGDYGPFAVGVATQTSPSGCIGYGNNGGNTLGGSNWGGGGGGGAGGVGGDLQSTRGQAGNGGAGIFISMTGGTYGAGGGAGSETNPPGSGGSGIGGVGGYASATAGSGVANTGSGGGGCSRTAGTLTGGSGGSGIVIVRYINNS